MVIVRARAAERRGVRGGDSLMNECLSQCSAVRLASHNIREPLPLSKFDGPGLGVGLIMWKRLKAEKDRVRER